ncbi:MAG TPA: hypothetical protein VF610_13555, partial [Segetibacter sp.]
MKKINIVLLTFCAFTIGARPIDTIPEANITNGLIKAKLYLPNEKEGYYRGTRFDWSGVMPELEYKGHTYFGQWFTKYSPTLHDAIMGPVEDFYPVGYDEAKVGESFLKVGIGMVTKPEEPRYFFVNPYKLSNTGSWEIKKKKDRVEFEHSLTDKEFGYKYKKTVQLVKGKPQMVLAHTLKNTGKRLIETNVYNHNFFVLDKQSTGTDFVIKFPFTLKGEASGREVYGKLEGGNIVFLTDFKKNEHLYFTDLQGYGDSNKDYDIRVENHKTGAAVRVTSDQPLSKLV